MSTNNLNVREIASEAIKSVFDTMFSMPVTEHDPNNPPQLTNLVSGSVGFAGEKVTGAAYIHVSEEYAKTLTATMLGMTPEELTGEAEVNDVIGEVCNMLAGGVKSSLCDAGLICVLTIPSIIRGKAYRVAAMPNVRVERMFFDYQEHPIIVEIHTKTT